MRVVWILGVACFALQGGPAAAAAVAAYSATGYGAFSLVSARSALTGEDVSGYLAPAYYDDTISYSDGPTEPNRYYRSDLYTGDVSGDHGGAVGGTVETPGGSAASYLATYLTYEFAYLDALYCEYGDPDSPYCPETDLGAFVLTFDYYLEAAATVTSLGGTGEAIAGATIEMSLCGETYQRTATAATSASEPSESDLDTLFGSCSILLERGNSTFVDITVLPAEGAAVLAEVASVPLPAALPLLAAGLGGLGLLGRQRGVRASAS